MIYFDTFLYIIGKKSRYHLPNDVQYHPQMPTPEKILRIVIVPFVGED